jgi:protein involved in polysaccharide export with SLBB domain
MLVPALRLEDGDSVVVDSILSPEQSLYVSIGGMVNKPGRYPWSEAMTLRDLVQLARGPEVGAYLEEAEIARMPGSREQGELAHMMRVPLDSSYLYERDSSGRYVGAAGLPFPAPGTAPEVVLEPFDQVMVLRQPEFELQRTVTVTGEVRFPGPYALTSKDERVSDLLERAGGVLPTAYVDGGRFYRELDDAGRIDVNLSEAITQPGGRQDIILQPGDSLDIPEYIPTVRVTGAVTAPTSVLFREGADLEYYIENAGGYARRADRRTRVDTHVARTGRASA